MWQEKWSWLYWMLHYDVLCICNKLQEKQHGAETDLKLCESSREEEQTLLSLYYSHKHHSAFCGSTNRSAVSRSTPASPRVHPPPPSNNHREVINSVWVFSLVQRFSSDRKAQKLLDGLSWSFVQTFMIHTEWILNTQWVFDFSSSALTQWNISTSNTVFCIVL